MSEQLRVTVWNAWKGNSAWNVRRAVRAFLRAKPGAVFLMEVSRHHDLLEELAKEFGYVLLQEEPRPERRGRPVPEHGSSAALVRPEMLVRWRVLKGLKRRWKVFSKNRWHEPRRPLRVILRNPKGRVRWKLTVAHGPTRANVAAVAEYLAATARWLRAAPGVVAASIGDHNVPKTRLGRLVRRVLVRGRGVDSAVVVGAESVQVAWLGKYGADHRAFRVLLRR